MEVIPCLFKGQSNWNRAALASQIRLDAKHSLDGIATSEIVGMIHVRVKWTTATAVGHPERVAGVELGKLGIEKSLDLACAIITVIILAMAQSTNSQYPQASCWEPGE